MFRKLLNVWLQNEENMLNCLSSYVNVSSRLRLLRLGDGDSIDACDEALANPQLKCRLEEAHALEVSRLTLLLAKLAMELEQNLSAMGKELDKTDPPASQQKAELSPALIKSKARSTQGSSQMSPSAASSSLSVAEFEWMSDVVAMLSLELWRKEELLVAILGEGATTRSTSKASQTASTDDRDETENYVLAHWRHSSVDSFVDTERLEELRSSG